jgi:hypothetical protein
MSQKFPDRNTFYMPTQLWLINTLRSVALLLCGLSMMACTGEDPAAVAKAQAEQVAANEAAAKADAAAFDTAVTEQDWRMAKAHADIVMAKYPGTETAKRLQKEYDAIKAKAETEREDARTAALWSYTVQEVTGGQQTSAAIYSKDPVDVDGTEPTAVRLIFRDHPSWGRSSYLVLQTGDFDCYDGCHIKVTIDDKPAKAMDASRPKTDEAIAMFIEDERALWRMTKGAKQMRIEFPAKGMGKRSAVFEVAGLDHGKLAKWN